VDRLDWHLLYAIARETSAAISLIWTNDRLAQLITRLADSGAIAGDPGVLFNFDTGTADEDPGAGLLRANNADLSDASFLYVSETSRGGSDITAFLASLDDGASTVKGVVTLLYPVTEEQATFNITAYTNTTNYHTRSVGAFWRDLIRRRHADWFPVLMNGGCGGCGGWTCHQRQTCQHGDVSH
jgi:hypothetical protein